jgi:hypothetical protein
MAALARVHMYILRVTKAIRSTGLYEWERQRTMRQRTYSREAAVHPHPRQSGTIVTIKTVGAHLRLFWHDSRACP